MTIVIKSDNNVANNKMIIKEYNNSYGYVTKELLCLGGIKIIALNYNAPK